MDPHAPPGPPDSGTRACHAYFKDAGQSFSLLSFLIDAVLRTDYMRHVAKKALEPDESPRAESPAVLAETDPGPAVRHLRRQSQLLLELFLSRLIDGFQCYLVELLREVLSAQPQILKSSQPSLSLEYAFQFASMDDLITDVIGNDLAPRIRSTGLRIRGPERGDHEGKAVHGGADHRGAQGG